MGKLILSVFISLFGMVYLYYGKKTSELSFILCGLVLTVYPYFVSNLWLSGIIGVGLVVIPFIGL